MAHWLSRVQICCHLSTISSSIVVSFSLSFHPHSFHTRTHTHVLTHWLRISNYSQTRGDWHYWHGLDRSVVQLLFQRLYCSIFGNYTTSPTPLRLCPSLTCSHSPGISLLLFLLSLSSSRGWRCGRGQQQQPSLWWLHYVSIRYRQRVAYNWPSAAAGEQAEWRGGVERGSWKEFGGRKCEKYRRFERWRRKTQQAAGG